jgi:S1-C subfamily serine protease
LAAIMIYEIIMKIRLIKFPRIFWCVSAMLLALHAHPAAAEPGFLGLEIQGFDKKVGELLGQIDQSGVLVKNVAIGEAGAMAGFRRGDLIIEFNRTRIIDFDSLLTAAVKTNAGQKIPVTVLRKNRKIKLTLKSGRKPAAWKVTKSSFANYSNIGITVAAITKNVRERFAIRWDSRGVVVTLVDAKSKVVSTGLRPGDVILQANLKDIWLPSQLTKIITEAKNSDKSEILVLIESSSGYRYSLLPLKN